MQEPRYLDDARYPGPATYPPPAQVRGLPTQAELEAYQRMFTWGDLKEIVFTGELEQLQRNKEMQHKYDIWSGGIKREYGSTENYLTGTRLPWAQSTPRTPQPTYGSNSTDDQSKPSHNLGQTLAPPTPPATGRSFAGSGTSTPSSAGFVSLETLTNKLHKHKTKKFDAQNGELDQETQDGSEDEIPDFLRYDETTGLDKTRYAVLFNDWPYNTPYGVRHYCVWSRVPIAHPHLVDYDPTAWERIESEGLGGFTGITPISTDIFNEDPISSSSSSIPSRSLKSPIALPIPLTKTIPPKGKHEWYAVDCTFGGREIRKWAGVGYESQGGQEVGKMVRSLWDERGWECVWFVNPPRLQSVPGFSHFHVFARRKTPDEIDASEHIWGQA